jgi:hypothetical protein
MHDAKSKSYNGGHDHLLLWKEATPAPDPTVRFEEAVGALDAAISAQWTLAVGAADLDGDLLPELYLAQDFGPDQLLHNRSTPGKPLFVPLRGRRTLTTPASFVLGRDSFKGMGVDFADLNGDGMLDIYVSNIADEFALQEAHFLWLSDGDAAAMADGRAPYVQESGALGLDHSGWGWESKLADFDNDGTLEAVQAVGFLKGTVNRWPELQALGTGNDQMIHDPRHWPRFRPGDDLSGQNPQPFFVRAGDGRYYDVASDLRIDDREVARGIAIADVDGDGDLDFARANQFGPSYFFRNACPHCGAFLGLKLLLPLDGRRGDGVAVARGFSGSDMAGRPAIGAEARVTLPDGRRFVAQADGGNGHSGKRSPELHFGLGAIAPNERLDVELHWRDGHAMVHKTVLSLTPGWHTLLLGADEGGAP